MARTRTTKTVAQRIDLNYFKRATPFKRAKLWLAVLAPVLAVVWTGWHFFGGDQSVYSSGRLSPAHAVLEKQCLACHVREAGGFSAKAADSACLACHDGPAHHPEMTASNAPRQTCAACHVEHRGQMTLATASTRNCAECHGDLGATGPGSHFAKKVQSLADGHPEFAALRAADGGARRDPGMIKLNHAVHMRSIRRGPTGPMVQLECSDCHRPSLSGETQWKYGDANYAAAMVSYTAAESFEPGGSRGLPTKQPWSDRQLMAPVKFANACAGCHLLTFDKRFEEGVPHDRPDVVHAFLVKKFAEYVAAHPAELRETQEPARTLAGRDAGAQGRTASPAQWVGERVAVAEELLWHKTCAQCHAISGSQLQDVKIARWDSAGGRSANGGSGRAEATLSQAKLPRIEAAHTRLQWLPHARFDHDAHTGFACAGCHSNALKSTETSEILVPGIAACQTCHAPGPGYASAECSECHTYHDWSKRKEVKPAFVMPGLKSGGN
jgi:Cytochrome c7 and related cytochrome c